MRPVSLIKEGREMSNRSLACELVLKDLAAIIYQYVEDIKMESTQELSCPTGDRSHESQSQIFSEPC